MPEDSKISAKLEKEKRIKKELKKLKALFKDLPKDVMNAQLSLLENAAFMAITLQDLQEEINLNGCTSPYQNGENQWGTKKSPEVDIYNTMIKNHTSIIKQIADKLPESVGKDKTEEILNFAFRK